jgi:4-amino-4-deoxy-L-arabinose transferase-like glycosyltransferase
LPLERDEGEYAYTGQLLLQGIPPYKLAYSMKLPGTAASYALLMSIFGDTTTGIHLGLIVINLVTVGLIFFLGRYLMGELAGVAAAATYGVISLMPYVLGHAAHATHFVVLPAIAGALVLLRALNRQSTILILASGCLFGLALLMKQPGLFFVLFGVVYLFSRDRSEHVKLRQSALRSLIFLLGATVPLFVTCLLLWNVGVFEKFWFWNIKYAGRYGSQVSIADGLRIFADKLPNALGTAWPIWGIAAIGLLMCVVEPNPSHSRRFSYDVRFFFHTRGLPRILFSSALFHSFSAGRFPTRGVGSCGRSRHHSLRRTELSLCRAPAVRIRSGMANVGRRRLFLRATAG